MRDRDDDRPPETHSAGRLDPPARPPITAVGGGDPEGEEPQRRPAELYDQARYVRSMRGKPPLPLRVAGSLFRGVRRAIRSQLRRTRG